MSNVPKYESVDEKKFIENYNKLIQSPKTIVNGSNEWSAYFSIGYKMGKNLNSDEPVTELKFLDLIIELITSGNKNNIEIASSISSFKKVTLFDRSGDFTIIGSDYQLFNVSNIITNYSKSEYSIELNLTFDDSRKRIFGNRSYAAYSHFTLTPTILKKWLKDRTPENLLKLYKDHIDKLKDREQNKNRKKNIVNGTSKLALNSFWNKFENSVNDILEDDDVTNQLCEIFKSRFLLNSDSTTFRCGSNFTTSFGYMEKRDDVSDIYQSQLITKWGVFNERFWTKTDDSKLITDISDSFFEKFKPRLKLIKNLMSDKKEGDKLCLKVTRL